MCIFYLHLWLISKIKVFIFWTYRKYSKKRFGRLVYAFGFFDVAIPYDVLCVPHNVFDGIKQRHGVEDRAFLIVKG
jgi:hypothetical protein